MAHRIEEVLEPVLAARHLDADQVLDPAVRAELVEQPAAEVPVHKVFARRVVVDVRVRLRGRDEQEAVVLVDFGAEAVVSETREAAVRTN